MKKKNIIVPFIFVLLVLFLLIEIGFAQVRKEVGKSNGWREIQFDFGTIEPPFFSWCVSSKKLVLGGKGGKGIRLLDIESGNIQELTTDIRHEFPSCSYDGRYVFFTDRHYSGNYKTLYVFDLKTQKTSCLYKLDKPLPIQMIREPVSPLNKYVVGPPNWKDKIILPGGEEIKVVPIYAEVKIGEPKKYLQFRWSLDGERLYLLDANDGVLFMRDLKTNKDKNIQLRINTKGLFFSKNMKSSPDGSKIYIPALSSGGKIINLYIIDLEKPEYLPRPYVENIEDFDIDSYGNLIFSRLDKDFTYLYALRKGGKAELIKKSRIYYYPIIPRISKDGKAVAYLQKIAPDENAITVLLEDDF